MMNINLLVFMVNVSFNISQVKERREDGSSCVWGAKKGNDEKKKGRQTWSFLISFYCATDKKKLKVEKNLFHCDWFEIYQDSYFIFIHHLIDVSRWRFRCSFILLFSFWTYFFFIVVFFLHTHSTNKIWPLSFD